MRRFAICFTALVALAVTAEAQAGPVLDSILSPGRNDLNDASVSQVYDAAGTLIGGAGAVPLAVGDTVVSLVSISQSNPNLDNASTLAGQVDFLFSAQITSVVGPGLYNGSPATIYGLAPTAIPSLSINGLLSTDATSPYNGVALVPSQFPGGTFSASTVFAMLENPSAVPNITHGDLTAALNGFRAGGGGFSLDASGGMFAPNAHGSTDFLQYLVKGVPGTIPAPGSPTDFGQTSASFSHILSPAISGYGPISQTDQTGVSHTSDFARTSTLRSASAAQFANGWRIADSSVIAFVTPEPSSLVIVGMGVATVAGASLRRRRKAKLANVE